MILNYTRSFGLQLAEGDVITSSLVPLADMINYRHPPDAAWYYDKEKEGLVVKALVDIKKGEEVCFGHSEPL